MKTKTISLSEGIEPILATLSEGDVVVFPSANTYGLLADATNRHATERIYEFKDRDRTKPLGYLSSPQRAHEVGRFSEEARKTLDLWPCPLSVVVPKTARVPLYITSLSSILLVCPDETSIDLVNRATFLIACTSANLANRPPVTSFEEARAAFEGKIPLIVDGGASKHGASGTMIAFSNGKPTVLRLGPYPVAELRKTFPDLEIADELL